VAISDDIREVLEEVGTAITINSNSETPTTGWYVDFESYPDQSTLFVRMFLKMGSLAATCPAINGDIVAFGGTTYLITNHVPTMFENAVVENIVIFYRCNVLGTIENHSDTPAYDANYERTSEWVTVGTDIPICMVEKQLLPNPEISEDLYRTSSITNIVYLSDQYPVLRGDRITVNGNPFLIETVGVYELDGILVCGVTEDHR
jgi:hypothetical protein